MEHFQSGQYIDQLFQKFDRMRLARNVRLS
jgi:hypothetical protein